VSDSTFDQSIDDLDESPDDEELVTLFDSPEPAADQPVEPEGKDEPEAQAEPEKTEPAPAGEAPVEEPAPIQEALPARGQGDVEEQAPLEKAPAEEAAEDLPRVSWWKRIVAFFHHPEEESLPEVMLAVPPPVAPSPEVTPPPEVTVPEAMPEVPAIPEAAPVVLIAEEWPEVAPVPEIVEEAPPVPEAAPLSLDDVRALVSETSPHSGGRGPFGAGRTGPRAAATAAGFVDRRAGDGRQRLHLQGRVSAH